MILGVLGAVLGTGSFVMVVCAAITYVRQKSPSSDDQTIGYVIALCFCAGFLCFLVASRAWLHLRRPDRGTANDIVGIASYLVGFEVFHLVTKLGRGPMPAGTYGPMGELLIAAVSLTTFYLLHRLVIKPIAARAFPEEAG